MTADEPDGPTGRTPLLGEAPGTDVKRAEAAATVAGATADGAQAAADGAQTSADAAQTTATAADVAAAQAQATADAAEFAANNIGPTQITDDAIQTQHLTAGAVVAATIAAGAVTTAKIAATAITAGMINAGTMKVGSYIQSQGYVAGVSGWKINADGTVEFSSGTFRGDLEIGSSPTLKVESSGGIGSLFWFDGASPGGDLAQVYATRNGVTDNPELRFYVGDPSIGYGAGYAYLSEDDGFHADFVNAGTLDVTNDVDLGGVFRFNATGQIEGTTTVGRNYLHLFSEGGLTANKTAIVLYGDDDSGTPGGIALRPQGSGIAHVQGTGDLTVDRYLVTGNVRTNYNGSGGTPAIEVGWAGFGMYRSAGGAAGSGAGVFFSTSGGWRVGIGDVLTAFRQPVIPSADNSYTLGSSSNRWSVVRAAGGVLTTSDARLKRYIVDSPLGLDWVRRLRPRGYQMSDGLRPHTGFLAQEVRDLLVEDGTDWAGFDDPTVDPAKSLHVEGDPGHLGLNYAEFIAPLVAAVQELATRLEAVEACRPCRGTRAGEH